MQPSLSNPSGPSPLFGAITGSQVIQNKNIGQPPVKLYAWYDECDKQDKSMAEGTLLASLSARHPKQALDELEDAMDRSPNKVPANVWQQYLVARARAIHE
jgi:hypothetical protein